MSQDAAQLEVQVPQFQGPLDLLLHLIQKQEVEIRNLPIASITDQYLSYLDLMQALDIDVASEYLVMASTLLYLKSQSMLPSAARSFGDAKPEQVREELVRQLLEYKRFREAGLYLQACEDSRADVFARTPDTTHSQTASKEYEIHATLFDLLAAFKQVLEHRFEFVPDFPDEINEEPITVEEKIREVLDRLETDGKMEFGALMMAYQSKLELVCTFLAILELARMRQICATQEEPYGPISIELNPDRPDMAAFELTQYDGPEATEANY